MELSEAAAIVPLPTFDPFLDGLFNLDNSALYYRFMYHLVKKLNGGTVVELGVCTGRGTAHIAAANPNVKVIGLDPSPMAEAFGHISKYPNIKLLLKRSDDLAFLSTIEDNSLDFVFFDTLHEYDLVSLETKLWTPKLKSGGMMAYDDITLNDGMKKFWEELSVPKQSLPYLHWSGFGIARKP